MLNKGRNGSRHIPVEEVTKEPTANETNQPMPSVSETEAGPALPDADYVAGSEVIYEATEPEEADEDLIAAVNEHDTDDDEMADGLQGLDGDVPETHDDVPSEEEPTADAVSTWVSRAPDFREPEVAFLTRAFGTKPSVDENDDLMVPVTIGDWTMLLVYDRRFPRKAEHGPMAKLYFVSPTPNDISEATGIAKDAFSAVGDGNERYLVVDRFERFCRAYRAGRSSMLMAARLIQAASELRDAYEEAKVAGQTRWVRPTITQSKYTDTRTMTPGTRQHPACRKVVLSNRAFVQIYNETQAHIRTETGGLLLGHFENGVWYVVEASDPGWDAVFRQSYHEANEDYENHVCEIMSRTYRHPLAFLGMWHRHPGSLDTFSGTDDATNSKYVDSCGNGCISALVNYDPDYRITFYYVERTRNNGVAYYQVDVEVGDERFDNPEILQVASVPGGARGVVAQPDPSARGQGAVRPPLPANPYDGHGRPGRRGKGKAPRNGGPNGQSHGPSGGFFMMFPRL